MQSTNYLRHLIEQGIISLPPATLLPLFFLGEEIMGKQAATIQVEGDRHFMFHDVWC